MNLKPVIDLERNRPLIGRVLVMLKSRPLSAATLACRLAMQEDHAELLLGMLLNLELVEVVSSEPLRFTITSAGESCILALRRPTAPRLGVPPTVTYPSRDEEAEHAGRQ